MLTVHEHQILAAAELKTGMRLIWELGQAPGTNQVGFRLFSAELSKSDVNGEVTALQGSTSYSLHYVK